MNILDNFKSLFCFVFILLVSTSPVSPVALDSDPGWFYVSRTRVAPDTELAGYPAVFRIDPDPG